MSNSAERFPTLCKVLILNSFHEIEYFAKRRLQGRIGLRIHLPAIYHGGNWRSKKAGSAAFGRKRTLLGGAVYSFLKPLVRGSPAKSRSARKRTLCECVELSALADRARNWLAGLAAGCDRLVHPAATGPARDRQKRLLAVLLAAPFIVAPAIGQAVLPIFGGAPALALLCATFGASWLIALGVATRGLAISAEISALCGAALLAYATLSWTGGLASPLALMLFVIPMEAYWITRSSKAAGVAAGAAVSVFVALGTGEPAGNAAGWQWLSPLFYIISLAVRWGPRGEQEQPQAEAASGTLPETSFDAVVARMTRGAEVETVSPQAARLLEIEPDLLLAMGLFERMHIADRVTFLRDISLVRQDGVARSCELRIRLPKTAACGGGYRLFLVELLRASDKDDAIVAVIRDGRHIAAMREELAQARAMADATEVAKGRFLAAVSHELRTPLNAIIGFSDMLLHPEISGELSARQSEHVTLIREAGNHLLSVVNAILDVSKIEAGAYPITVDPFEPEPMIELCRAMMTPQAMAKGVSLTSSTPRGLGELVADQRAFQQILLNLVSNAIKFTPEGGSVGISALREGETMRIFVSDNGIGISEEDLEKLGRPFMQVQNDYTRQFQGTGLGLSLVKGLVKLHGGTMSIESAPGLGTTVAIALPAMEGSGKRPSGPDDKTDEATAVEENYGIALRKIA